MMSVRLRLSARSRTACVGLLGALGMFACGGGGGGSGNGKSIPSLPAYPAANEAKAEAPAPAAKPKDPKEICAGAPAIALKAADGAFLPMALEGDDGEEKMGFASLSFVSTFGVKAKEGTYSMADLQALEKKGSWEELLGHAEDVPPAQRGAPWDKLVERAASGQLQTLASNTASFEGVFTSQALLRRYPQLTKSPDFMTKRGEAGKTAAEVCLRESYRGQHCIDMMKDFLKTANTPVDVGFAFGKITRKNQNHYVAVPFFKWALDQKKEASWCGDEDLKLAVVAGLGLPTDYENAAGARHIATNACWDNLKADIRKELIENPTGYYRDNACAVMKAKGDL